MYVLITTHHVRSCVEFSACDIMLVLKFFMFWKSFAFPDLGMFNLWCYLSLTVLLNTYQFPEPNVGDGRSNTPHREEDTHVDRQWLRRQDVAGLPGGSLAFYGDTSEEGVNYSYLEDNGGLPGEGA